MSRRNTYLLGGLAVLLGAAMLAIAVIGLTGDDESPTATNERNAPEAPITPGSEPSPQAGGDQGGAPSGTPAEGENIRGQLARRKTVPAPGFSAQVIHEGSVPRALEGAFDDATDDGKLDIGKLRGTPVVLQLWSSKCAPCRGDSRLVEATWKRWGQRGVLFLGASVKEPPAAAKAVIEQYDLTYPSLADPGGGLAERYGTPTLPHTFFISADGDIVGEVAGSPSVRQLELGAQAAESGKPFGSEQGSSRVPLR
jgi:peroxiredoxin